MSAVFIGQSPLQILNLIEASSSFDERGVFYIVYENEDVKRQIIEIIRYFNVTNFYLQRRNIIFKVFFPFIIGTFYIKTLKRNGRPDSVFYGTFTSWASLLVNLFKPRRTVLVDDGQKTINVIKNPTMVGLHKKRSIWLFSRDFVSSSTFFTFYSELAAQHGIPFRANRLKNVSDLVPESARLGIQPVSMSDIVFIGTNILSSYNNIFDVFDKIITHAAGRKIYYLPHRRDRKETLDLLARKFGIHVVANNLPIELTFGSMWRAHRPDVWAFSSTAIDTLLMLNEELVVTVFRPAPAGYNNPKTAEAFESIFQQYRNQPRVRLVDITD